MTLREDLKFAKKYGLMNISIGLIWVGAINLYVAAYACIMILRVTLFWIRLIRLVFLLPKSLRYPRLGAVCRCGDAGALSIPTSRSPSLGVA